MDPDQFHGTEAPDLYTDSVRISVTPYSFILDFGLSTESPGEQKRAVTVRMSPQHAFVLHRALGRHIDEYQRSIGNIALPEEMLRELGLAEDD